MICECCGHELDEEEIFPCPPPKSPEEIREDRIIHDFRKRTDPAYARYCEAAERMERAFLFGVGAMDSGQGVVVMPGLKDWAA